MKSKIFPLLITPPINLSPEKQRVYDEVYRVLKKGGRIAISDVVLVKELTEIMKRDEKIYCG